MSHSDPYFKGNVNSAPNSVPKKNSNIFLPEIVSTGNKVSPDDTSGLVYATPQSMRRMQFSSPSNGASIIAPKSRRETFAMPSRTHQVQVGLTSANNILTDYSPLKTELGVDALKPADNPKKRRAQRGSGADKAGKGLRHFSIKVCEKVERKGVTTYNEVADELVKEFANKGNSGEGSEHQYDEKNIRRRVYDALNVLMAIDFIAKEKKEIRWKGLPSSSLLRAESIQADILRAKGRVDRKKAQLQELQEQLLAFERLVERNDTSCKGGDGVQSSGVFLPFILVQTPPQATVEVMISEDMHVVKFDFNGTPFELHDDVYVLKAMGLCDPPSPNEVISPVQQSSSQTQPSRQRAAIFRTGKSPSPSIMKQRVKHEQHG